MKCPQCGTEAQPEQRFCAVCGTTLPDEPHAVAPNALEGAATIHAAPPASSIQPLPTGVPLMPYNSSAPGGPDIEPRSSRFPVFLVIAVAALVVLGTIAVFMLPIQINDPKFPVRASGDPTLTPGTPGIKPSAILDASADAMMALKTFHYESEVGFYGIPTGTTTITGTAAVSVTVSGDVKLPDSYTMNTDVAQIGQYVVIGDSTWTRRNGNQAWTQSKTGTDVGLGPINPLASAVYLQYYESETSAFIGLEQKGGVNLQHVRFQVDTQLMAADTSAQTVRNLLERSKITADAWIRESDHLLDRLSLAVDMQDGTGVILRTAFSGFNTDIEIQPPK